MAYDFNEHKHRYAVWTAARAQRAFTEAKFIKDAIAQTTLKQYSESSKNYTQQEFDDMHRLWANQITSYFDGIGKTARYGRAAKIIAIYLKTSVVLPDGGRTDKSLMIHPPVDKILLTSLSSKYQTLNDLSDVTWTTLEEDAYWNLVLRIRKECKQFDWRLEEHWKPEREAVR